MPEPAESASSSHRTTGLDDPPSPFLHHGPPCQLRPIPGHRRPPPPPEIQLSRRDKLLNGIDPAECTGAEIGPLDKPVVQRTDGQVVYVDHCDTAALKAKWAATDPTIDLDRLHVDAVWGADSLHEAIVKHRTAIGESESSPGLDYVIASHVIEHVPDLVKWLSEVEEVLKSTGQLCLAIPDKRYTFDYLRQTSTLAQVVSAYLRKDRVPNTHCILDFMLNMAPVDCAAAWSGGIDPEKLERRATFDGALAVARDALENGNYHDVHCWVFTPASFAHLCVALGSNGLLHFECASFFDTARDEFEFFVAMRPCRDATQVQESWRRMLGACRP